MQITTNASSHSAVPSRCGSSRDCPTPRTASAREVVATGALPASGVLDRVEAALESSGGSSISAAPPLPVEQLSANDNLAANVADVMARLGNLEDLSPEALARVALILQMEAEGTDRTNVDELAESQSELAAREMEAASALSDRVQNMNCPQRMAFARSLKRDLGISFKEAMSMVREMRHGGEASQMIALAVVHAQSEAGASGSGGFGGADREAHGARRAGGRGFFKRLLGGAHRRPFRLGGRLRRGGGLRLRDRVRMGGKLRGGIHRRLFGRMLLAGSAHALAGGARALLRHPRPRAFGPGRP